MQQIWDEVAESDVERDRMLLQLEQECLNAYKQKLGESTRSRDRLLQTLDDSRAELTNLLSTLDEYSFHGLVSIVFHRIHYIRLISHYD